MCSGRNTSFIPDAEVFLTKSSDRIGRVNIKALYIEFTDATFTTKRVRCCCLACVMQSADLTQGPTSQQRVVDNKAKTKDLL